jgi:heterotetrameric sarcosine oxidase gamma subunit
MSELLSTPARASTELAGLGKTVGVRLRSDLAITSVLCRSGRLNDLVARVRDKHGFTLRDAPKKSASGTASALGIGPGRWLFLQRATGGDLLSLQGPASLADQTDSYAVFEISGPDARKVLAKGVPLDIHPSVFLEDDVAVTVIAHMGAIVWRDGPDRFVIAVFRSYTESFWHWLNASSAEFVREVTR